MADEQVIGIDLGGSAIKLGRFDRSGHCWQSLTIPTPQPAYPDAVLEAMVAAIAQLDPENQSRAIGVGTPGPVDATGRVARVAINLAGWQDVPLADWLEAKMGKPTILANDANCAGLGEYWLGAGQAFQTLILLTLGTGVGGAIVLNGELFVGHQGTGAELGLITLNHDGPECNSGNRGSLEQYVSVQAIRRQTGLEPHELAHQAQAGDSKAIAFWQHYGRDLGAGLASLVYVLTPEAILIGGGVSASAKFFFPAMEAELKRRVLPSSRAGLQLLTATLGNQAGMTGAAKLAWQHLDKYDTLGQSLVVAPTPSLDLSYRLAIEMAQFKAGFLSRASHELRSPLNSVISVQQLILADLCESPEEEREFTAQANVAAKKMLNLLDEVITVSKAEYGSMPPDIQPLQLAEVLQEVHTLTHLQAQNRSIRLVIEFPADEVTVLADRRWLKQVLVNLIETPIGLMPEGSIRVTTQVSETLKQAHIQIEDQRPRESWQEPIDLVQSPPPEASVASMPTRSLRPMGLTLLVCQTLLEQMQGRLEIVHTPDPIAATDRSPNEDSTTCLRCILSIPS